MKRRELFKFLAAAPAALAATPVEPPVEKIQDRVITLRLPADLPPGSTITITNLGNETIAVMR